MPRKSAEARKPKIEAGVEAPTAVKMELREVPKPPESLVGRIETKQDLSGADRQEITVSESFEKTQPYVTARIGADGETRLRAVSPSEANARENAGSKFEQLWDSSEAMLDATLKTMQGMDTAVVEKARAYFRDHMNDFIARAVKADHPGAVLGELIKAQIEELPETKAARQKSLADLEAKRMHAVQAARKAEQAGDEKGYQAAEVDIYALDKQILEVRSTLAPKESKAEQQAVVDQQEGFVEILPEPIYGQGVEAVQTRVKALEVAMTDADKKGDQLAWNTARNEYDRHRAILPTLERVQKLQTLESDAQKAMDDAVQKQLLERSKARARTRAKKSYWNKVSDDAKFTLDQITTALRLLEKSAAGGKNVDVEYAKVDADRKQLEAYLNQVQGQIESLHQQNEQLKETGVEINLEPDYKVVSAKTELYMNLATLNRQNPDLVQTYLVSALKNKDISPATLTILKEFKGDLDAGRLNRDENLLDSRYGAGDAEQEEQEYGFAEPAAMETTRVEKKPTPKPETAPAGAVARSEQLERRADVAGIQMEVKMENGQYVIEFPQQKMFFEVGADRAAAERIFNYAMAEAGKFKNKDISPLMDRVAFVVQREKNLVNTRTREQQQFEQAEAALAARKAAEKPVEMEPVDESQMAREMPIVTPDMLAAKQAKPEAMPGFGEWVTDDEAKARHEMEVRAAMSGLLPKEEETQTTETEAVWPKMTIEAPPSAKAEAEWFRQTGEAQFEGAWKAAYPDDESAKSSLLSFGVPKNILKKYPTPQALYQFVEKPGLWARINGDADKTQKAINRFIEAAVATTESTKIAGEQARTARTRLEKTYEGKDRPRGLV